MVKVVRRRVEHLPFVFCVCVVNDHDDSFAN